ARQINHLARRRLVHDDAARRDSQELIGAGSARREFLVEHFREWRHIVPAIGGPCPDRRYRAKLIFRSFGPVRGCEANVGGRHPEIIVEVGQRRGFGDKLIGQNSPSSTISAKARVLLARRCRRLGPISTPISSANLCNATGSNAVISSSKIRATSRNASAAGCVTSAAMVRRLIAAPPPG